MKNVVSVQTASHPHWVGDGFPVKTLLSYQAQGSSISPFLLLDHAGPMQFSATSDKRGVGSHPHRGFETVTLVYSGEVAHRDSTGEQGIIGVGDVQWMTAGSGILHEEYHSDKFAKDGGQLEMLQLWVNLPRQHKMTPPRYQTILAEQIPHISLADNRGSLRIVAGKTSGMTGPAKTYSPILVIDGEMKASGKHLLPLPDGWSAMVIVLSGKLKVNFQSVTENQTLILSQAGAEIMLQAEQDTKLLILAGEPINEPIVGYGPFVMNSDTEIKQALHDFQTGKFGQLTSR